MNWYDVLPSDVAIQQIAWERRQLVVRMRRSGFKFHEIARRLGVSTPRARQIFLRGADRPTPPVVKYTAPVAAVREIAEWFGWS